MADCRDFLLMFWYFINRFNTGRNPIGGGLSGPLEGKQSGLHMAPCQFPYLQLESQNKLATSRPVDTEYPYRSLVQSLWMLNLGPPATTHSSIIMYTLRVTMTTLKEELDVCDSPERESMEPCRLIALSIPLSGTHFYNNDRLLHNQHYTGTYFISFNGFHPTIFLMNTACPQEVTAIMCSNIKTEFVKFM